MVSLTASGTTAGWTSTERNAWSSWRRSCDRPNIPMNPKDEPRRAIGSPRSLSIDANMDPLGNCRIFAFFRASDKAAAVPQLLRQGGRREAVFRQDALAIGREDRHREPVGIRWRIGDHGQAVVGADRKLVRQRDD